MLLHNVWLIVCVLWLIMFLSLLFGDASFGCLFSFIASVITLCYIGF